MGEVWVWSIGVFFSWYVIYMFFTACSIGIGTGIGFTGAIERLSVMERMEYHSSVVLYVAREVWISMSVGVIVHSVIAREQMEEHSFEKTSRCNATTCDFQCPFFMPKGGGCAVVWD